MFHYILAGYPDNASVTGSLYDSRGLTSGLLYYIVSPLTWRLSDVSLQLSYNSIILRIVGEGGMFSLVIISAGLSKSMR